MWMLNKKLLRNVQGVNIASFGKKTSVISIDSLEEHHAGNYTCVVKNKAGVASFHAELIVKGILRVSSTVWLCSLLIFCVFFPSVPPRITPFYFEDNPLSSGQYAQVNCLVSEGDLPVTIEWTLNDQKVDNYAEISMSKVGRRSSILTIEAVSYSNSGNYTCLARNEAGITTYTTQLLVNGYCFS